VAPVELLHRALVASGNRSRERGVVGSTAFSLRLGHARVTASDHSGSSGLIAHLDESTPD
jgi:hypothetical protein